MTLQAATERPQVRMPLWMRIGFPCMFLALALVRILDNGLMKLGWISDLCMAVVFLIFVPRVRNEPIGTYFKQPRTLVAVLLFGTAFVFGILFDARHFFAN